VKKVAEWTEANNIIDCYLVGRDMGAAPPRQTEIRMKIPGATLEQQLDVFLSFTHSLTL
jgi:hypothetical protein